jgi:hypothetical protein
MKRAVLRTSRLREHARDRTGKLVLAHATHGPLGQNP